MAQGLDDLEPLTDILGLLLTVGPVQLLAHEDDFLGQVHSAQKRTDSFGAHLGFEGIAVFFRGP